MSKVKIGKFIFILETINKDNSIYMLALTINSYIVNDACMHNVIIYINMIGIMPVKFRCMLYVSH